MHFAASRFVQLSGAKGERREPALASGPRRN
jgi:hypothetical protein